MLEGDVFVCICAYVQMKAFLDGAVAQCSFRHVHLFVVRGSVNMCDRRRLLCQG